MVVLASAKPKPKPKPTHNPSPKHCKTTPLSGDPSCDKLLPHCFPPQCAKEGDHGKAIWFKSSCYVIKYNNECYRGN